MIPGYCTNKHSCPEAEDTKEKSVLDGREDD